jgi:hypothetical protein
MEDGRWEMEDGRWELGGSRCHSELVSESKKIVK